MSPVRPLRILAAFPSPTGTGVNAQRGSGTDWPS